MTREIKFRAWDGNIMYSPLTLDEIPKGITKKVNWLQYTGLKDKNGVEIYEGDIVEFSSFEHGKERRVVVYNAPTFWLYKRLDDHIDVDAFSTPSVHEEVIGNIYENPELLKAKS